MRSTTLFALTLLAALLCSGAHAQIVLDGSFENGNLDGWNFNGTHHEINTNNPPGAWQWVSFRITGALGQQPQFRTRTTTTGDVYRSYHRMVWRYDGQSTWRFMDHGAKPGDGYYYFGNTTPFAKDVVYVAYWQPYTFTEHEAWVRALRRSRNPALEIHRIGESQQGRPIDRLTVRAEGVPVGASEVVVVGRQHGYESLGNHVIAGMIDFLLSPDERAQKIRRRITFHFYPMANPDAVHHGWTREGRDRTGTVPVDFNRDWQSGSVGSGGTASATVEIDALRDDIMSITGGSADVLLDIHSHAKGSTGLGWYWWYKGSATHALALQTAIRNHDLAAHPADTVYSWPQATAGGDSTTAMCWGAPFDPATCQIGTLGGLGLTLEPIAAPFGANRSRNRIRSAARAIVLGVGDQLP